MEIEMNSFDARAPWPDRKVPLLARLIGARKHSYWEGWKRTSIRAPYGEVRFGAIMIALSLGSYGRPHLHVAVPGVQVFFRLPRWRCLEHLTRAIPTGRKWGDKIEKSGAQ
jgi:hypothetical protein